MSNWKIKKNWVDSVLYVVLCVATLGSMYILRLAISQGIRKAIEKKEYPE